LVYSIEMQESSIIYVDDDNTHGPWDGTLEHPYNSVQDGIDNASAGDTVFVKTGQYLSKQIIIPKPLTLLGENMYDTFLSFSGYSAFSTMIDIRCSNVKIVNFTISNRNKFGDGIHIIGYNKCTIKHNMMYTNYDDDQAVGVYLEDADNNIIHNNEFHNFWRSIVIADSTINSIKNNNFYNYSLGGPLFHAFHLKYIHKFIFGNRFDHNYYHERIILKSSLLFLTYFCDVEFITEMINNIHGPKIFAIPIPKWLIIKDPTPDHGITFPFMIPNLKFEWLPAIQPNTIGDG